MEDNKYFKKAKDELNFKKANTLCLILATLFVINHYTESTIQDIIAFILTALWIVVTYLGIFGLLSRDEMKIKIYAEYMKKINGLKVDRRYRKMSEKIQKNETDLNKFKRKHNIK